MGRPLTIICILFIVLVITTHPAIAGNFLNNERFEVTVQWKNYNDGTTGQGTMVKLTGDSGYFWFFHPENVELMIKVLDGRTINGCFWVIYGALSDVEYTIRLRDLQTTAEKTYYNPAHRLASNADIQAFPVPGLAQYAAVGGSEYGRLASLQLNRVAGTSLSAKALSPDFAQETRTACSPGETLLCLNQSRFSLEVSWRNYNDGSTGSGHAVLISGDSGYFWFFDSSNVEMVAKVLDGKGANGYFWVMYGALTDVEYTLTVTDTLTGAVKSYYNPPYTIAGTADVQTFRGTQTSSLSAAFTFSPSPALAGQATQFTDTSTGNPTSWSWSFGDGSSSTSQNPSHSYAAVGTYTVTLTVANAAGSSNGSKSLTINVAAGGTSRSYPTVDTAQTTCYEGVKAITCPTASQAFYGQDAQFTNNKPSYAISADGLTVNDNITGLTWQRSADSNGDGTVSSSDKLTWAQAQARPAALNAARFGGFSDWRMPTIKELYSLIVFTGTDPSGFNGNSTSGLQPFIDNSIFRFAWGDTSAGERIIDAQYWSSTSYVSTTMSGNATVFGVNFADGRIKGYPRDIGPGGAAREFLLCVRGNPSYGINNLTDHGDQTITDIATGLMWSKGDSGAGMNWQSALAWVTAKNATNFLGHHDWRLPNAKELQSIVDYTRSPDTTGSPAISALFSCTQITNEAGKADYPFYWTGTTHGSADGGGSAGIYVAFGRAMGFMNGAWIDVHGAGAQRSDPKTGNASDFPQGRGPQGDAIRINNYLRLVRNLAD